MKYSTKAYVEFYLNEYYTLQEIEREIDNMRYLGGNTNTSGGLWLMREEVSPPPPPPPKTGVCWLKR